METKKDFFWDVKTVVLFLLCIIWGVVAFTSIFMSKDRSLDFDLEKQKSFAATFIDEKLYAQAIDEYKKIVNSESVNDRERANISYLIGNIFMENLREYENALAFYHKSKLLGPDESTGNEIDKKIVSILERMGRSVDAKQKLETITALDKKEQEEDTSQLLAKIGNKKITQNELDKKINELPPFMRNEFIKDPSKKKDFLGQYISKIVLLNSAQRKGLDKDPEILKQIAKIKEDLIVQKMLESETGKIGKITEPEIKAYYESNKDEFLIKNDTDKDKVKKLDEVKAQIEFKLRKKKQEEIYRQLIQKLMTAEEVKVFDVEK